MLASGNMGVVAGLLAYCFCGYTAFLVVWTLWKGRRPEHAKRWMRLVEKWGQAWRRTKKKVDGWMLPAPIAITLSLICLGLLVGAAYSSRSNTVTEHNVAIYRQLDDGDWLMSSDEEQYIVFRPCAADTASGVDVNGLLKLAVGYVADEARWEERGTCKSILRSDLGFWFRDEHNNFAYKRVN